MISGPQRAQTAVVCLCSTIALAASQDCFPRPCLPCQLLTNVHILLCCSALGSPPASCVSSASLRQPFVWRTPRALPCRDSSSRSAVLQPSPAWTQPCGTSPQQQRNLPDSGDWVESISPGQNYVYRMK